MMSWHAPLTVSRRVASVVRQQPTVRSSTLLSTRLFFPQQARWIPLGGRRALSSNRTIHERIHRKQWTAVLVLSGSTLAAVLLYRQTPARMDALRARDDTARQSEPAEKPVSSPTLHATVSPTGDTAAQACLGVCVSRS